MYARTFGFTLRDSQGGEKTKRYAPSATHARFLNGRMHHAARRVAERERTRMFNRAESVGERNVLTAAFVTW